MSLFKTFYLTKYMHLTVGERFWYWYLHESCLWQFVQTSGPWCRRTVGSLPGGWTTSPHSPTCPLVYHRAAAAPPQGPCTVVYQYDLKWLCCVHMDSESAGERRHETFQCINSYLSHYIKPTSEVKLFITYTKTYRNLQKKFFF